MSAIGGNVSGKAMLAQLQDIQSQMGHLAKGAKNSSDQGSTSTAFSDMVRGSLSEVNTMQTNADKMAVDLATGKTDNIHETMLAATKAELGFNLMVQVRNKVLEAYQEVMRMQI